MKDENVGSRDSRLLEVGSYWTRQDGQEVEIVGVVKIPGEPTRIWYRTGRIHKDLNIHCFLQKHRFARGARETEPAAPNA